MGFNLLFLRKQDQWYFSSENNLSFIFIMFFKINSHFYSILVLQVIFVPIFILFCQINFRSYNLFSFPK